MLTSFDVFSSFKGSKPGRCQSQQKKARLDADYNTADKFLVVDKS